MALKLFCRIVSLDLADIGAKKLYFLHILENSGSQAIGYNACVQLDWIL